MIVSPGGFDPGRTQQLRPVEDRQLSQESPDPSPTPSTASGDGAPSGDAESFHEGDGIDESLANEADNEWRRRVRRVVGWSTAAVLGVMLFLGFIIRVDYVALKPGSARDTEPLVTVDGAPSFPSDGEIVFTTVKLRQELTLIEYLWTKQDDESQLLPATQVLGDRSPDENREHNLEMMVDAKQRAVAVALELLGYDVISSDGVVVAQVIDDTAASGHLELGDTILAVDGEPVETAMELVEYLKQRSPGDSLTFEIERFEDGTVEEVTIEMGAREDDPDVAFLGIAPLDREQITDDLPFDVEIDSGSVGGPSAGLAFTLAVLDRLTPGELTGGGDVAVTGTIAFNGAVGPVGGVPQKAVAVREAGISYFIVPLALGEEELDKVRELAGDELEIIAVATVDEALEILADLGGNVSSLEEYSAEHS